MANQSRRKAFGALATAALLSILFWEVVVGDDPAVLDPKAESISVGVDRACVVLEDQSVVCWLEDWLDGELVARQLLYQQVSAGEGRACGVTDNGRLICQGWGQVWDAGEPGERYLAVDSGAGYRGPCAIRLNGTLWCDDEWWDGQSLPDGRYQSLSLGYNHGCALSQSGSVVCWGEHYSPSRSSLSTAPSGLFTALSAGDYFACALDLEDEIVCWGDNLYGQLEAPSGRFLAIDVGGDRACALDEGYEIACWGDIRLGESPPTGTFHALSVGSQNACAVTMDGKVACWGARDEGWQGSAGVYPPNGPWRWVSGSSGRQCALRGSGELFCRGGMAYRFHLADARYDQFDHPTWQSCSIRADGTVACPSSLSVGSTDVRQEPAGRYQQVESSDLGKTSASHSCSLHKQGWVHCWGRDSFGQAEAPGGTLVKIAVGSQTNCALSGDGSVTCWGRPFVDPIRGGSPRWTETYIGPFIDVEMMSSRVCAIRENGRVACRDQQGWQTSDPALGSHVQLAMSRTGTCALTVDAAVHCWGNGNVAGPTLSAVHTQEDVNDLRVTELISGSSAVCGTLHTSGFACWKPLSGRGLVLVEEAAFDVRFARLTHATSHVQRTSDYCGITTGGIGVCGVRSEGLTLRLSSLALKAVVPASDQPTQPNVGWRGRLAMRHLSGGGAELRFEPEDSRLDVTNTWTLPPSLAGAEWQRLGNVVVKGESWGELQARRWIEGSIEASLVTSNGDRVLERGRFLPSQAPIGEWQRSGVIHVRAPVTHVTPSANRWDSGYARVFRADGTSAMLRSFDDKDGGPTSRFKLTDSGSSGTCAITHTDHVICTGFLRTLTPPGRFVSLSVGRQHACGLRESGELSCWGSDTFGQASPPSGVFREVSAGGAHTCAILTGGELSCWGLNWQGQSSPPSGVFRSVSSGMAHSCAVRDDHALVCWGANGSGQSALPEGGYRSISAAAWHTCGVTVDHLALCWGREQDEYAAPEGYEFMAVFASGFRNYGVTLGGGLVWWGWHYCRYSRGHGQIPADSIWPPQPIVSIPSGKAWCS